MSARGIIAALWMAAGLALCAWLDRSVSVRVLAIASFVAAASMGFGRRLDRAAAFDDGYRLAARHATDIARLAALRADEQPTKQAIEHVAESLKNQLEIAGERAP